MVCTVAHTHHLSHAASFTRNFVTHIHIHTFIHTYVRMYIHAYIHTYVRTHVHTYIYIHTCMHTIFSHTFTHSLSPPPLSFLPSPTPLQPLKLIIGRSWLVGLSGPLIRFFISLFVVVIARQRMRVRFCTRKMPGRWPLSRKRNVHRIHER